jgi:hypothetical protein
MYDYWGFWRFKMISTVVIVKHAKRRMQQVCFPRFSKHLELYPLAFIPDFERFLNESSEYGANTNSSKKQFFDSYAIDPERSNHGYGAAPRRLCVGELKIGT